MSFEKRKRKSVRLKGYDYASAGAYFVTVCVQDKQQLFGNIANGVVTLSESGQMIDKWWRKMFEKYKEIKMGEYVIMPNHFHGIIQIVGAIPRNRPNRMGENMVSPVRNFIIPNNYEGLGKYISWFKRVSTNEYICNVKNNGWQPFDKRIWHRNYYEHVVRNEDDLNQMRTYIQNNPLKWDLDEYNPKN